MSPCACAPLVQDTNTTHHVVESSMEALAAAHPSESDFVRIVAELVSDISDLIHNRPVRGEGWRRREREEGGGGLGY